MSTSTAPVKTIHIGDDSLSPGERKRQAIIDGATSLFRELLGEHIIEACADANETFTREDGETTPKVKLGFTVEFEPLNEAPDVGVKIAWTVKRRDEATVKVEPEQRPLPFGNIEDAKVTIRARGNVVVVDKDGIHGNGGSA